MTKPRVILFSKEKRIILKGISPRIYGGDISPGQDKCVSSLWVRRNDTERKGQDRGKRESERERERGRKKDRVMYLFSTLLYLVWGTQYTGVVIQMRLHAPELSTVKYLYIIVVVVGPKARHKRTIINRRTVVNGFVFLFVSFVKFQAKNVLQRMKLPFPPRLYNEHT